MSKRDCYEVLGINRNADEKSIKRAYRKLAKKYHPDTNQGDSVSEKKFKEITEAYSILGDKEKRKLYDQYGFAAFDEGFKAGSGYNNSSQYNGFNQYGNYGDFKDFGRNGNYSYHFEGDSMDDIFNFFNKGFGRNKSKNTRKVKGEDIEAEVSISFDEAFFGCDKMFQIQGENLKSISVHIPAGISEGKKLRLKGKGYPGFNGGIAGDLLLKIHVEEKNGYERKDMDIYTSASIPFTTAVFGGEAKLPTLYGDVLCKIPQGTQSGQKIRLKNKGAVSMTDSNIHGDEFVEIQIQVPKKLSPEAAKKLHEFQCLV